MSIFVKKLDSFAITMKISADMKPFPNPLQSLKSYAYSRYNASGKLFSIKF
jgi:hypothetical protein